jgi:hypothetical protein
MGTPGLIEQLFDRFAADLSRVRPELTGKVLCPLCLRSFGRAAIGLETDDGLTKEHPIPSALGGNWVTLTCKKCNNEDGSALDAHFVRMIRSSNWMEGDGSTLKGTVRLGDVELPTKISWTAGDKPNFISKIPDANPAAIQEFRNRMRSMQAGDKIHVNFSLDYAESNARRALIRIGFLALFHQYDYKYALSGAAEYVRKLIRGSDPDQLWRLLPHLSDFESTVTRAPVIISAIAHDNLIVAFLIFIQIDGKHPHAVLLPAPTVPEESVAIRLFEVMSKLPKSGISIPVLR